MRGYVTRIISAEAYMEGLLWRAAGTHPQGAKQPGYGSWSFPPVQIATVPGQQTHVAKARAREGMMDDQFDGGDRGRAGIAGAIVAKQLTAELKRVLILERAATSIWKARSA